MKNAILAALIVTYRTELMSGAVALYRSVPGKVLILICVPPVYWAIYRGTSTLFWLYGIAWVPHTISLLISIQLAWTIWTRVNRVPGRRGN